MATSNDWMSKYQQQQKEDAEKGKAYFLGLLPMLKAAGAAKLVVQYDGSGDSGQVESVTVYSDTEGEVPLTVPGLEEDKADGAACDILSGQDINWYDNEGGFGDVVLTVETGKLTIEHNVRISDSNYEEYEV